MRTCATCRFMAAKRDPFPDGLERYNPDTDEDEATEHRTCVRIVHGNGYKDRTPPWGQVKQEPAVVIDGSGYAARLLVLPTFGCTLHEPRPNEGGDHNG